MKTPAFWQTNNLISTALLPASLLYGAGAWLDRSITKPKRTALPVIAIGNATAGGAGKTPTTLALVPLLRAIGHTPHILTHGYRGSNLTAHRVTAADTWQHVGDEALLLAAAAPTWVGRNRLASAKAAASAGATILLCDDALQHHALHKDISILVIDGPYGIGNTALLPAGPLREPLAAVLARSNAVIIIGPDAKHLATRTSLPVFPANLNPTIDTNALLNKRWLAFAGIGRPEKFFITLRDMGANLIATQTFADHQAYSNTDISQLIAESKKHDAQLITTTKDAVKIPAVLQPNITVLPVELTFENPASMSQFLTQTMALKPTS
ncbi:MAG: tetraacyldisaccharide 4'-kinase [Rickettsiales bacterium]